MDDQQIGLSELSRGDWYALSWGFLRRGLLFSVGSGVVGGVAGGIIGAVAGAVLAMASVPLEAVKTMLQLFGVFVGFGLGFLMIPYYLRWLLSARFGNVRLVVARAAEGGVGEALA